MGPFEWVQSLFRPPAVVWEEMPDPESPAGIGWVWNDPAVSRYITITWGGFIESEDPDGPRDIYYLVAERQGSSGSNICGDENLFPLRFRNVRHQSRAMDLGEAWARGKPDPF